MLPEDQKPQEEENKVIPLDASEIHNDSIESILAIDNGDAWDEENPQTEVKVEAPVVETPVTSEIPVPEPLPNSEVTQSVSPVVDTSQISQKVAEEVINALSGGEEKTDKEQAYIDDAVKNAPWVKENRNPTYAEVIAWNTKVSAPLIKDQIKKELQEEVEAEEKATKEAEEGKVKLQQDADARYAQTWTNQLDELTSSGKIPKVVNRLDANDAGVKARIELMNMLKNEYMDRSQKGLPVIEDLRVIYYEKYEPAHKSSQVAGADAPVYGSGQAISGGSSDKYSASEIHNSSIESLLMGK